MSAVFNCPYCEKTYPNSPALIGRKVRCSSCKEVFQLQGDGSVIKIEASRVNLGTVEKNESGSRVTVSNQLTRRTKQDIKKSITKRLERSRSSLREAAAEAVAAAQQDADKVASEKTQTTAHKRELAKSVQIHRGTSQQAGYGKYILGILAAFGIIIFLLIPEEAPERTALNSYAARVDRSQAAYPMKMQVYRERMWLFTRDGTDLPPVIVNADDAEILNLEAINWQSLIAVSQEAFGGMSIMPFFAILVNSDKQAMVEQLWEDYRNKYDVHGFYKLLQQEGVRYLYCKDVPEILQAKGVSKRDIYIVSLLMAGTRDQDGNACYDFGLVSSISADEAVVYEFRGREGMELIERANEYAIHGSSDYCGLIIGFSGVQNQADELRVLDVRYGASMDAFYDFSYNPFRTLADRATNHLQKAYANPNFEDSATATATAGGGDGDDN